MSKARTAGTLIALVAILGVMLVLGWQGVRSPFPPLGGGAAAAKCQTVKEKSRIFRREITVSVYNGTRRQGLADQTMAGMEKRSFKPGTVGNAPSGKTVPYVEVRSTVQGDPAAQLVAEQFKPAAKVVLANDELGPGIDVILGPRFKRLHVPSPRSLKLAAPRRSCLDNATPTPGA
ncbi:MAG: LytR C-terminal domain-containing protein [Marmoricola sp.]